MEMELKILDNRITEDMLKPATDGSAGIDLHATGYASRQMFPSDIIVINPNKAVLIKTGIAVHIKDPRYAAMILPRSGLGHKKGLILGNSVGLIDSDYHGELMISAWNRSTTDILVGQLEKIAQLIFVPVVRAHFKIVPEFSESTDRCEGGFGSTDK